MFNKCIEKLPGAYCKACGRYYTFKQFDKLRNELIYPQTNIKATYSLCECGSHEWCFVG